MTELQLLCIKTTLYAAAVEYNRAVRDYVNHAGSKYHETIVEKKRYYFRGCLTMALNVLPNTHVEYDSILMNAEIIDVTINGESIMD